MAGMSAAACLAQQGMEVTVLEKNGGPGGRAGLLERDGFRFDKGPSWYWMPDVIEQYFHRFQRKVSDYMQLERLDPAYQAILGNGQQIRVPAGKKELLDLFESMERGSAAQLERFLLEAGKKYRASMDTFIYKPSLSWMEFADPGLLGAAWKMDLFRSFAKHVRRYFKNPDLLRLLEFPVLFLGATPEKTPALYSLMNYADLELGTWYPAGGMYRLSLAMEQVAKEQGVRFLYGQEVTQLEVEDRQLRQVITNQQAFPAQVVVAAADYHHVEQQLLAPGLRSHSESYWQKRTLAPSCLIYYAGVNKRLPSLLHHNLFFDSDFRLHAQSIYETHTWPEDPLFYVCCPSRTDPSVAPAGMENLFILIPVSAGLTDTDELRHHYFAAVMKRIEQLCGTSVTSHLVVQESYAPSDFVREFHSFKGNAYGLANTLLQTAVLKPAIRSRKVDNLFFAGQLTVPGPGIPPAIISGQVVADYILRNLFTSTP